MELGRNGLGQNGMKSRWNVMEQNKELGWNVMERNEMECNGKGLGLDGIELGSNLIEWSEWEEEGSN